MGSLGSLEVGTGTAELLRYARAEPQPSSPHGDVCPPAEFGEILRRQCADFAGGDASNSGITLTCTAAQSQLSQSMTTGLALIARGLVASAYSSFTDRQHGRIGVSFRVSDDELKLTVEHSGTASPAARSRTVEAAKLEQLLAAQMGGQLDCSRMIGGVRIVVTVPRR